MKNPQPVGDGAVGLGPRSTVRVVLAMLAELAVPVLVPGSRPFPAAGPFLVAFAADLAPYRDDNPWDPVTISKEPGAPCRWPRVDGRPTPTGAKAGRGLLGHDERALAGHEAASSWSAEGNAR